ncbi:MAG: hypothetical protein ACOY0T_09235 [Myxococcota bacterium]
MAWSQTDVAFYLSRASIPPAVEEDSAAQAVEAALASWSAPACSFVRPFLAGWTDGPPAPNDQRNTIGWVTNWAARSFPAAVPGHADLAYRKSSGAWTIEEADIYLNAEDYRWQPADVEPLPVITHEAGHALGLLHPCETDGAGGAPACGNGGALEASACMYPTYAASQSTLNSDDVAGICFLYPDPSTQCDACAAGEVCIDRECRAPCGDELCAVGQVCAYWGCTAPDACVLASCVGQRCDTEAACAPFSRCEKGTCVAGTVAWGDPCRLNSDCADGACLSGICQPRCTRGGQCPQGATCEATNEAPARACVHARLYPFGSGCIDAEDCESGLCVFSDSEGVCTHACSSTEACDRGWQCSQVDGRNVCSPLPISPTGGCSVTPGGAQAHATTNWFGLCIFGLPPIAAIARRRKKWSRRRT